jgi:hypothetical protein
MRRALVNPATGRWIISLLLLALCVRALVPAGYMPSTERPFSFQICPDGFPAQLLKSNHAEHHHHHHDGGDEEQPPSHDSMRGEHCVFAPAAGAGPAPAELLVSAAPPTQARLRLETESAILSPQRFRQPLSRAPPTFS